MEKEMKEKMEMEEKKMTIEVEVSAFKRMSWDDIRECLWFGEENAELIEKAGKEEDFMGFLEQWKGEEALTHGKGYWTLEDIDQWLGFDWEYIQELLGIKDEEE